MKREGGEGWVGRTLGQEGGEGGGEEERGRVRVREKEEEGEGRGEREKEQEKKDIQPDRSEQLGVGWIR